MQKKIHNLFTSFPPVANYLERKRKGSELYRLGVLVKLLWYVYHYGTEEDGIISLYFQPVELYLGSDPYRETVCRVAYILPKSGIKAVKAVVLPEGILGSLDGHDPRLSVFRVDGQGVGEAELTTWQLEDLADYIAYQGKNNGLD